MEERVQEIMMEVMFLILVFIIDKIFGIHNILFDEMKESNNQKK